jgi:hypothetical protein
MFRPQAISRLTQLIRIRSAWFVIVAVLCFTSFGIDAAHGGIITSMQVVSNSATTDGSPSAPLADQEAERLLLRILKGRSLGTEYSIPASTSTSGGPTTSFGVAHPYAEVCTYGCSPPLCASGWVVPESALALPPVPTSGLFRPPRPVAL